MAVPLPAANALPAPHSAADARLQTISAALLCALVPMQPSSIMPLVRRIAVINQKGGVGKTTTVANLGAALAQRGHRTCLVDLDPQSHLTLHFGLEPGAGMPGSYQLLTGDGPFHDSLHPVRDNLSIVPAEINLAATEMELSTVVGREQILADKLDEAHLPDAYLMMDCPPALGLLTLNALAAADEVFIPLQPHFLALQGLGKLLETVSLVRRRINPKLTVGGVILCMFESNTRLAGEVVADLEEFLAASRDQDVPWARTRIFRTVIRRNIKLAECPSYGTTIFDYASDSNGAADYSALCDEFLAAFPPDGTEPTSADAPAIRQPQPEPASETPQQPQPAEPSQAQPASEPAADASNGEPEPSESPSDAPASPDAPSYEPSALTEAPPSERPLAVSPHQPPTAPPSGRAASDAT